MDPRLLRYFVAVAEERHLGRAAARPVRLRPTGRGHTKLAAEAPRVVVPGHGDVGDAGLLATVRDYLRDETWKRRDSRMAEDTIAQEVRT